MFFVVAIYRILHYLFSEKPVRQSTEITIRFTQADGVDRHGLLAPCVVRGVEDLPAALVDDGPFMTG